MMIRFVKRGEVSKKYVLAIKISAVVLALIISGIFLACMKDNPITVYGALVKGAFGTSYNIKQTIIKAIPLIITGLGILIAFKMQFWNLGGEGQIIMGAFGATFVVMNMPGLPGPVMILCMFIFGIFFGALWALIPALLKAKWNANETIITLMMNYIALKFITYLQYGPWKDKTAQGFPKIAMFPDKAILPDVLGVHAGWIIAVILCVFVYIFMNHTKKGYEVSVIGDSEKTAVYAGIDTKKTMVEAVVISGILCSITGVIQASAVSNTLNVDITGNAGFTAVIVAWLSDLNPIILAAVSLFFAALVEGANYIQSAFSIPDSAAQILQALILFFVLGSEFFTKYKIVIDKKKAEQTSEKEAV